MSEFTEQQEHDELVAELRRQNNQLTRQLAQAKARKADLVHAVREAAFTAASTLVMPPVPRPTPDRRQGQEEYAVAVLSDWQLAKVTPTYSTSVCEVRIGRYADKVIELTRIQRAHHPVRRLYVFLLGDIVEGELIFPGQSHLIDASLFMQVCVDGPRILGNFVRRMLTEFDEVHVEGVIGNHGALGGRARRDYNPETNADAMLYEIVKEQMKGESRLHWGANVTPGERHWYTIAAAGEKRFMLFHGDQVKGYNGIPWYGFDRKIKGWEMVLRRFRDEQIDYALSGHFHTPFVEYINGVRHWGNGSTESYNTYAFEQLSAMGEPCQYLLFTHPRRGVTAEYLVQLESGPSAIAVA